MPSIYSARFRLNYQAPGDNLNTWGLVLNSGVFQLLEDAVARRVAFALSGSKTLTTSNGADDEARCAFLDVTGGTGGTITAPAVEKLYVVRNNASGDVVVTTGGGATATVKPGEVVSIVGDGANFRRVQPTDMLGAKLTGLGAPVNATDAVTKAYADGLAFGAVNLPGQGPGTVNAYLKSDGTVAGWAFPTVSEVVGAAPLAAPTFTGAVTASGTLNVTGPTTLTGGLTGLTLNGSTKNNVVAVAAVDLDLSQSEFFTKSISVNSAFTFSNATASKGMAFVLELTISAAAVPSWPASVAHPGGVNPSSGLGNGKHTLGFITFNGGTNWLMVVVARAQA